MKRYMTALCALLAVAFIGTAAVLATDQAETPETPEATPPAQTWEWKAPSVFHFDGDLSELPEEFRNFKALPEMTDEQKAEWEERRAEMEEQMRDRLEQAEQAREKWEALTDEQRAELDALQEQINGIQSQIIDKYLEWGLIDEETAAQMKEGKGFRVDFGGGDGAGFKFNFNGEIPSFHFGTFGEFNTEEFTRPEQPESTTPAQGTRQT